MSNKAIEKKVLQACGHVLFIVLVVAMMLPGGCRGFEPRGEAGGPSGLGQRIDQYLAGGPIETPEGGRLVALVVPEGTSPEALAVAAKGFKALEGLQIDTVVLVRQAHELAFAGAFVYSRGSFDTFFGPVAVDEALAVRLVSPDDVVTFNPHFGKDKYVEIYQLSFIKRVLGDAQIVPVLIGQPGQKTYDRLVAVLATEATRRSKRVLLVAVSDISYGGSREPADEKDGRTIESLKGLKAGETLALLRSGEIGLSGGHAAVVTMEAARRAGVDTAEVFGTSRSVNTGTETTPMATGHVALGYYDVPLNDAERVELLGLAWRSVEAAVEGRHYEPEGDIGPRLLAPGAAFVTLEKDRVLRGGVGQVQATGPLYRSVITSARAAALEDGRYPPVSMEELDELSYEVSVLTPLVPVLDPRRDIELGTHGLYLNLEGHGGMLLPQVPVEQGWDLDEYLRQISLRAGLPPDAWREQGARMWSFTTEIVR